MTTTHAEDLLYSLVGYPSNTEWLAFVGSEIDVQQIGKDVCAVANSAAFHGRGNGYCVWGVSPNSHKFVGTTFSPTETKSPSGQRIVLWLKANLSEGTRFSFDVLDAWGKRFVVLKVNAAAGHPVRFNGKPYLRHGNKTKKLQVGSPREVELWHRVQGPNRELSVVMEGVSPNQLHELLNLEAYRALMRSGRTNGGLAYVGNLTGEDALLADLEEREIIRAQEGGSYAITVMGALLLATKLSAFDELARRMIRIVRFAGRGAYEIADQEVFDEGYATALPKAEAYVASNTPTGDLAEGGVYLRVGHAYPRRAVRELLVNSVLHQDIQAFTPGPLVSIYDNRIEFSNPGSSLVPPNQMLNARPKTRNVALSTQLRDMGICEEWGVGWDMVVQACEEAHMLPPKTVSTEEGGTVVTLRRCGGYEAMSRSDRESAVYWHACLRYAQGESFSNTTLRERFGLPNEQKNVLAMSRLIRDCQTVGLIKVENEKSGAKFRRYVPAWA